MGNKLVEFKVDTTLVKKASPLRKKELTDDIIVRPLAKALGAIISSVDDFKYTRHKIFIGEKSVTVEDTYECRMLVSDEKDIWDTMNEFVERNKKNFDCVRVRQDSIKLAECVNPW